jgi:hypothetical protein
VARREPVHQLITKSPLHKIEFQFIVLILVPLTRVFCLDVANQEYCVFVALSQVLVQLTKSSEVILV